MAKDSSRVTLQDIAKATGYTVNTVSRALKNKSDIGAKTRAYIQQVASDMGYVRNYIASSLRSGRTKTIAMIAGAMVNPFYAILADLLQQEAVKLGYVLVILCSRDDPETETHLVEVALSRQVDGVLITPCSFDSPALQLLRSSGIPYVLLSRYLEGAQDDCVICDDEQGGYLAGRHLIEQGHRRLAMISFHQVVYSSRKRFTGFRRACQEAGIPEDQLACAETAGPDEILPTLLRWKDQGITGVFSFCDVEAWQCATLLENHGIRVPEDMELVGFDHIMKYVAFPKPICTVDPNLQEEARIAIELIRRRIHEPALPPQQVILPVSLTCYGTCARP